jgi:hypothetical protein
MKNQMGASSNLMGVGLVGAPLGLMGVGLGLCGTNQLCGGMISTSESEGNGILLLFQREAASRMTKVGIGVI